MYSDLNNAAWLSCAVQCPTPMKRSRDGRPSRDGQQRRTSETVEASQGLMLMGGPSALFDPDLARLAADHNEMLSELDAARQPWGTVCMWGSCRACHVMWGVSISKLHIERCICIPMCNYAPFAVS